MPDRIFESKKDWWLVAFVWAALALGPAIAIVAAFIDWPGWPAFVATLAACLAGPAIVVVLAYPVRYILTGDTLVVHSGIVLRWRVPISGIEAVEPSRTMLASPAWSLDRTRITYRDGSAGKQELVIAPQSREAFYAAVLERAPGLRRDGRGLLRT
jgi:hypothetical protein